MRSLALALVALASCHHEHEHDKKGREGSHGRTTADETTTANADPAPASMDRSQRFVHDFFAAKCADREAMIVFPEHNRERLRAYQQCAIDTGVTSDKCKPSSLEKTECPVSVPFGYVWLAPQRDGSYLVDLRATMREQPTLADFVAKTSSAPIVMRITGKLSTYVGNDIEVSLEDLSTSVHGYVAKDSPDGKVVLDLLQDGKLHTMTVVLAKKAPQAVTISRVLSPSYAETEAEHAYDGDAAN